LLSLLASVAHAEPPDAQTFAPPAGSAMAFTTPEPEVLPHLALSAGLSTSYALRPLVRRVPCDAAALDPSCVVADGESPLVRDLVQAETALALGLFDVAQLGVVAALAWSQTADDFVQPSRLESGTGLSDLRLDLDGTLLRGELAASVRLVTSLPTGDADRGRGSSGATFTPSLVVRQRWRAVSVASSLGYRIQERATVPGATHDDALEAMLGLGVGLSRVLELRAEVRGRFGTVAWVEGMAGAAIAPSETFELLAALGGAVPPSEIGEGAAALRAYLAARVSLGADARAPISGDIDRDGLLNARDACALLPEDRDAFLDEDGCPDLDDDADGLRDDADKCPRASEDRDGFEDGDGCPELDNDGDSLPDGRDACSMDPEDRDGFEDGDGCPEPGPKPVTVSIEEGRILVSERIYFEGDSDVLRAVSFPALDRIAEAIESLPAGRVVQVQGHTDDSGNAAYDLDVSYRRARAVVEYLKEHGVPAERLKHRGYGATRPIAKGATPDVRALNRRVELVLE
jgi:outer membrane protein OmpA-like peptidoglycan-associated protein